MKKPKVSKVPASRGRPPYHPSIDDRISVEQMKFCGESENVIARALGIDVNTLRKHLRDELENGHARRRRQIIGILFKSAETDNVTSAKRLEEMGRVAGAAEAVERRAAPKEPKLGKKQEQQAAAAKVGGKYAPPAPPKLVVNNR